MSIQKLAANAETGARKIASAITNTPVSKTQPIALAQNSQAQEVGDKFVSSERTSVAKTGIAGLVGAVVGFIGGIFGRNSAKHLPKTDDAILGIIERLRAEVNTATPSTKLTIDRYKDVNISEVASRSNAEPKEYEGGLLSQIRHSVNTAIDETTEKIAQIELEKLHMPIGRAQYIRTQLLDLFHLARRKNFDTQNLEGGKALQFSTHGDNIILEKYESGQMEPNIAIFENNGQRITYLPHTQLSLTTGESQEYNKIFIFDENSTKLIGKLSINGKVVKNSYFEAASDGTRTSIARYATKDGIEHGDRAISSYNPSTGKFIHKEEDALGSYHAEWNSDGHFIGGRYIDTSDGSHAHVLYDIRPSSANIVEYDVERLAYLHGTPIHYAKLKSNGFDRISGSGTTL